MNIPSHLGKYEIRGELGRGAMGVVYEAFDPSIERTVAIKVLHLGQMASGVTAEVRERFLREAKIAGKLSHAHIVGVHEYHDGAAFSGHAFDSRSNSVSIDEPYIVMERVNGCTLKKLFEEHARFSIDETSRLMGQLLSALQHAHDRGLVHRDIKPSNLMVVGQGTSRSIKVVDFGIARLDSSDLTLTGSTLGTTSHMSPEQFLGAPVDNRTDLYAAGVILYQLLTGELPFTGSPSTIMQRVLNQEALSPSLLNTTLPKPWDDVVRKGIAKNPSDRFASADEFAAAVRATSSTDPDATVVQARRVKHKTSIWSKVAIGGLATVFAVFVGKSLMSSSPKMPTQGPAPAISAVPAPAPEPSSAVAVSMAASFGTAGQAGQSALSRPAPASVLPQPAPPNPTQSEIEQAAWLEAATANTAAAYRAFLKGFPKSRFAGRAHVRLAVLDPQVGTPTVASVPSSKARDEPTAATNVAINAVSAPNRGGLSVSPAPSASAATVPASAQPNKTAAPDRRNCQTDPGSDERCPLVLGLFYLKAKDFPQALKWFKTSAEHGNSRAQHELGMLYYRGRGVTRDSSVGFGWVKRAAEQGLSESENVVGVSFQRGEGVPQNKLEALAWFRKSAEHGNSFGQNNLANALMYGQGSPRDPAQAVDWYRRSATQRNAYAAVNLGRLHEKGEHVAADKEEAARWYRLALEYGLESTVAKDPWGDRKLVERVKQIVASGTPNP